MEDLMDGQLHTVCAYVEDVIYEKPYGSSYRLILQTADDEPTKGKINLEIPFSAELAEGDMVVFDGVFSPLDEEYLAYQQARGVFSTVSAENVEKMGEKDRKIHTVWKDLRSYFSGNFEKHIGGEEAGFATAILTGEREGLLGRTKLAFQRLGISHLLAVSGLHLSVIIGGFDCFLRLLTLEKRKKNVLLIVSIFFFAAIAGFTSRGTHSES
jgi:hypothetical protein